MRIDRSDQADGPGDAPAHPDSALRTEQTAAYHALVDAVYRQYDIDHGHARVEKIKCEAVIPGMHLEVKSRLAEAADLKKSERNSLRSQA